MISRDDSIRSQIAVRAGEWYVANDAAALEAADAAALAAWLRESPVHIEEFLGVSALAQDLKRAGMSSEHGLEAMIALGGGRDDGPVRELRPGTIAAPRRASGRRWRRATAAVAVCCALGVGALAFLNARRVPPVSPAAEVAALRFQTRHAEQLSQRLSDGTVLHLNTDSAVVVQFRAAERLITLTSGQAEFDVAHESARAFRVVAGSAAVVAVGTQFDVRLDQGATTVTVVAGRVIVEPARDAGQAGREARAADSARSFALHADQQATVSADRWQAEPVMVDARRATAWLRRQIVFEQQPLERVAAEFNRYAPRQIEIATPALRHLEISGVFATDDVDAFIAFLRSLPGVQVEVTASRIRVLQNPRATPAGFP